MKILSSIIETLIFSSIIISAMAKTLAKEDELAWIQRLCQAKEKTVRLHFYVHDALSNNPDATVYEVAESAITSTSPTSFGQVRVLDNLVTAKPGRNSTKIGRVQGLLVSADFKDAAFGVILNFVFIAVEYNGSTLTVLGRNQILKQQREMPIVGGTGMFAMARGRSVSSTYSYDPAADYGILEYTLDVAYV